MEKTIMHYDMDAFYASIEIRDNPTLKNKPVVVGKTIVTTASYEARKYGIHSAMSVVEARNLCPQLIILNVNMSKYIKISRDIQNLIKKLSTKVEFIASDEGYVEISEIIKKYPSKEYFAKRFQRGIWKNFNLTCSVGIGYNKLTAKIASDINKPAGVYVFSKREEFIKWISYKSVKIIPGVGKKTVGKLEKLGIKTVDQIYKYSLMELVGFLGRSIGETLYQYSRGLDYRQVDCRRKISSIGTESSFRYRLESREAIEKELNTLFGKIYLRLLKKNVLCKTIVIKIRYESRKIITRSRSFDYFTREKKYLYKAMITLLQELEIEEKITLVGVYFGNISKETCKQLTFRDRYNIIKSDKD